ncbi:MAG: triple tyrosine motif-containing protein [Ferruginibacter sp.]
MLKKYSHYIFIVILLLSYSASFCQEAKIVKLTKYTQNEGLSSYYVTKIIKDVYGFMWVGTQEGLNLFDGRSFQVFFKQAEEKKRLGASFVIDMVEDKKRSILWVITAYGNICGIDLKTRTIIKRINFDSDKQSLSGKWIRSIAVQGDTLWFGGLGVISGFNIKTNSFIGVDMLKKAGITKADCNISKIIVDKKNTLWLFCDGYGILALKENQDGTQTFRSQLANDITEKRKLRFWDVSFHKDELYVGTSWGLRVFKQENKTITYLKNTSHAIVDTAEILSLSFTSPGQLLFSTPNGFWSTDLTTKNTYAYHDQDLEDDWLTLTYQIFYDSLAQKTWVGTQSGLASFDGNQTAFNIFSRSSRSTTRIRHAFSLLPISNDEVYCGDENGLFKINTANKEIEKIDNGSSNLMLFKDAAENIFLSNKSGFYLVNGKVLTAAHHSFPSLKQLENDQFNCAAQYNDSILLFGSVIQKGLSVWNNRSGELKIFHNDSSKHVVKDLSIINNLFKSNTGKVFILTEKSIIDFDPLTGTYLPHTIMIKGIAEPIGNFMDMCETPENYWIATYGDGVIETDKYFHVKNKFSTTEGLGNNCVYKIFSYNNKSILATTNNGLSTIDCKTNTIQKYFQSDGLHSSLFEQVCGYQYAGKIYAGGVNGFTVIDPAILFSNPNPPKLYINKITVQAKNNTIDTSNIFLNELDIPNDVVQVTISLSGLNYKNPGRTAFAYKINSAQATWVELGTQNFINLPPLPPGKYTLLFRSANEAGVWNKDAVSLLLIYLPKWYQTLLFKIILIAIVLGALYLFYKYRLAQIRKQQQIRRDIASDLHDDIGSILNSVKIFTHLAKKEPSNDQYLNHIEDSLAQASLGLRDMIWVLDDSGDTIYEVMERIKKYSLPVCQAKNILFESSVKADPGNHPFTKTQKRNFLLIAKEAINNSIKYSNCKKIQLTFTQTQNSISLLIEDDGNGFDLTTHPNGNGLKNISQRAEQIQLVAIFKSTAGIGTSIIITKKQ